MYSSQFDYLLQSGKLKDLDERNQQNVTFAQKLINLIPVNVLL